jgi:tRNA pseudouridine55 synthase
MDGILLIDKPERMTSHHVVVKFRHGGFGIEKIGHGGTLDPLATGLMVILVGRGAKMSEYVIGHDKTYQVTGVFGKMRDTFDAEGTVVAEDDTVVSREQLETLLAGFPREYEQMPPAYSAIKIRGVAAYKKAREGKDPGLVARTVTLSKIVLEDFQFPRFSLHVSVSAGTYIRSLVVDIAARLGTLAYVEKLRRLASGPFKIEDAYPLQEVLSWPEETLATKLRSMEEGVMQYPALELTGEEGKRFVDGQWLAVREITNSAGLPESDAGEKKLIRIRSAGMFTAMGYVENGMLKGEKTLLR